MIISDKFEATLKMYVETTRYLLQIYICYKIYACTKYLVIAMYISGFVSNFTILKHNSVVKVINLLALLIVF